MRKREIKEEMKDQKRTQGIPCPECGFSVEANIYELFTQSEFQCGQCLATINLGREESRAMAEALQEKIRTQEETLEKPKRFNID